MDIREKQQASGAGLAIVFALLMFFAWGQEAWFFVGAPMKKFLLGSLYILWGAYGCLHLKAMYSGSVEEQGTFKTLIGGVGFFGFLPYLFWDLLILPSLALFSLAMPINAQMEAVVVEVSRGSRRHCRGESVLNLYGPPGSPISPDKDICFRNALRLAPGNVVILEVNDSVLGTRIFRIRRP